MSKNDRTIILAPFAAGGLYLLLRFIGAFLFDNNWSFSQQINLPVIYSVLWLVAIAVILIAIRRFGYKLNRLAVSRRTVLWSLLSLLIFFYLFRFDSFLYGGANLLVDRIGISEAPMLRWYELGSAVVIGIFYHLLQALGFLFGEDTVYRLKLAAGVNALTIFSFLCTAFAVWGAAAISRLICAEEDGSCWKLLVIILFGPQLLLLFGYIGLEPIVLPFTIWSAYFIIHLSRQFNWKSLGILWLIQIGGVFFWFPLLFLLPSVVYITTAALSSPRRVRHLPLYAATFSLILLLLGTYIFASDSFWTARFFLFLSGKMPNLDYGLFSLRHTGDFLQSIWLVFPQLLVILFWINRRALVIQGTAPTALLFMGLSGLTLFFVIDPLNSIPFDLPRLSAYLAPISIFAAVLLSMTTSPHRGRMTTAMAVFALAITVGLLPSYVSIKNSEDYIDEYLTKHDHVVQTGIVAYRDAYFYKKNFDKANGWEQQLPRRSDDYLNYRGCVELVDHDKPSDALQVLPKVILTNPYWTEPRALLATIQMNAGRYELARPQIDTCILIEPYVASHYQLLYRCLRDSRAYTDALAAIKKADELDPDNPDILIDVMVGSQFAGKYAAADSLADYIIELDSTQAFPYAMKGFIAESQGKNSQAMKYYERFIRMAPDDPESMKIRKRLKALVDQSRQRENR